MKKYSFIFLLLLSFHSQAHPGFDSLVAIFATCTTQEDFKICLRDHFNKEESEEIFTKTLHFDFKHSLHRLQFEADKQTDFYQVDLILSPQNEIVYGRIEELNKPEGEKTEFRIDNFYADMYIKEFYSHYKKAKGYNQYYFMEELLKAQQFELRFMEEGNSEPIKQVRNLVKQKKYDQLIPWLQEVNPELQAYGMAGLWLLYEEGIKIQDSEWKIIEQLKNSSVTLFTHFDCRSSGIISIKDVYETYDDLR